MISTILKEKGEDADRYTDKNIDAINAALDMTILIYRIINTPLIDEDGVIEKESVKVVSEGQRLLDSIGG